MKIKVYTFLVFYIFLLSPFLHTKDITAHKQEKNLQRLKLHVTLNESKSHVLQAPTENINKTIFELEFKEKKPEHPINLDHWGKTGKFHADEKKVHYGTLDTQFGTFSIQRSFSTITEPSKQTQGPS